MLQYGDVAGLFPNTMGIKDKTIEFRQVYIDPTERVGKGLFIPVIGQECEQYLKDAINNGAIGAIWNREVSLPHFLPTHFPLFLVDNPLEALNELVIHYLNLAKGNRYEKMTKFTLSLTDTHNAKNFTYDSPVKDILISLQEQLDQHRLEGGE